MIILKSRSILWRFKQPQNDLETKPKKPENREEKEEKGKIGEPPCAPPLLRAPPVTASSAPPSPRPHQARRRATSPLFHAISLPSGSLSLPFFLPLPPPGP